MKRVLKITLLTMPLMIAPQVSASDLAKGKELHDENCVKCHVSIMGGDGSGIYTRPDRRIESLDGLNQQVNRCKTSLGVSWPEHQIKDVITYLNKAFYKFPVTDAGKRE